MTEWTKESLDALIARWFPVADSVLSLNGWAIQASALRNAILASQPERCSCGGSGLGHLKSDTHETSYRPEPERVEPQFKCGDAVEWFGHAAIVEAVKFFIHWDEPRYEIVVPSDKNQRHYDVLGQSLKGAGDK